MGDDNGGYTIIGSMLVESKVGILCEHHLPY